MTTDEAEITLKQFLNSTWFKGLARVGVVILLPLAGYSLSYMYIQSGRITTMEQDRALETSKNDGRIKTTDAAILTMSTAIAAQAKDIRNIETHLGTIDGKLSIIVRGMNDASEVQ